MTGFELYHKSKSEPELLRWIDQNPELREDLVRKGITPENLNTRVLQSVCEWARAASRFPAERQETAGKVLQAIRKLEKLRDLRNHSILAHGLRAVTREEVRETVQAHLPESCAGDSLEVYLFQWASDLLTVWGIGPEVNPYELFRRVILDLRGIE